MRDLNRRLACVTAVALALVFTARPFPSVAQTPIAAPPVQPPPTPPSLFISPCGQPFRSATGEPYPVARWFAQVDRDGDGRIDRKEFRADAEAFFRVLDRNHDGVIDGFEVSGYEHDVVPEILGSYGGVAPEAHEDAKGGGRRRDRAAPPPDLYATQGAAVYELIDKPEPVSAADTELTGHITLAAFLAEADHDFDVLDKTGRGYLTLADLPKTPLQAALEKRKRR